MRLAVAPKPGGRYQRVAFSALACLSVLGVAEAALRCTTDSSQSHRVRGSDIRWVERPLLKWALPANAEFRVKTMAGPIRVKTNSLGLRSPELRVVKGKNTLRILFLGDSTVFGDGVAEADSFPRLTESRLRARSPRKTIQVINAGVPGYSSFQCLRTLDILRPYGADIVVAYLQNSDIAADAFEDVEWEEKDGSTDRLARWARHLHLYLGLRWAWRRISPPPRDRMVERFQRVGLREYFTNLTRLVRHTRSRGQRLLLLVPPLKSDLVSSGAVPRGLRHAFAGRPTGPVTGRLALLRLLGSGRRHVTAYRAVMAWVARKHRVPIIDLPAVFRAAAPGGKRLFTALLPYVWVRDTGVCG